MTAKKIDLITNDGVSLNFNQFLKKWSDKQKFNVDLIDISGEVIFSTKENKCCWCVLEEITNGITCDTCFVLAKEQAYNQMADRRYNGTVMEIAQDDVLIGTEEMKEKFFKSGKVALIVYETAKRERDKNAN